MTESEDNVAAVPRQRRQKAAWVTESHKRIHKHTDTTMAFTSEYSKDYRIQGNVSTISKAQASSKDTTLWKR